MYSTVCVPMLTVSNKDYTSFIDKVEIKKMKTQNITWKLRDLSTVPKKKYTEVDWETWEVKLK